jgi:hypothetical protein
MHPTDPSEPNPLLEVTLLQWMLGFAMPSALFIVMHRPNRRDDRLMPNADTSNVKKTCDRARYSRPVAMALPHIEHAPDPASYITDRRHGNEGERRPGSSSTGNSPGSDSRTRCLRLAAGTPD